MRLGPCGSINLRCNFHAQVHGDSGVRQRSDGNVIDTRQAHNCGYCRAGCRRRPRSESKSAALTHDLHGLLHVGRASCCPAAAIPRHCRAPLPARRSCALQCRWSGPGAQFVGSLQNLLDAAAERNMIVLDQNAIGKIEAVILAAAAAHRVLVENAQPGNGLARIENFACLCPRSRPHIAASVWRCRSFAASGSE